MQNTDCCGKCGCGGCGGGGSGGRNSCSSACHGAVGERKKINKHHIKSAL